MWHQDDCQKLEPGCSGKAPWIRLSQNFLLVAFWDARKLAATPVVVCLKCLKVIF